MLKYPERDLSCVAKAEGIADANGMSLDCPCGYNQVACYLRTRVSKDAACAYTSLSRSQPEVGNSLEELLQITRVIR